MQYGYKTVAFGILPFYLQCVVSGKVHICFYRETKENVTKRKKVYKPKEERTRQFTKSIYIVYPALDIPYI